MYGEHLPVFVTNAEGDADELLPRALAGGLGLKEILELCRFHRIIGVGSLLVSGKPDRLHEELHRSGCAFRHYLEEKSDHDKVLSRSAPLFDAIACNDWPTAQAIAAACRRDWAGDLEYEDDYLYVNFLLRRFLLNGTDAECEPLLARYEAVLDGAEDPRFELCRSFLEDQEEAFERGLSALLELESERYAELLKKGIAEPEVAATEAHLSVEGLALVRLGERRGFGTRTDYPRIPSLARRGLPAAYADDSWKQTYE